MLGAMRGAPFRPDPLRRRVERVVEDSLCTGCGVCELISDRISMEDRGGFRRPLVEGPPEADAARRAQQFAKSCPGLVVRAAQPEGATRDDYLGPIVGAWTAWATDPEVRHTGSSGGTLTAIAQYLSDTGASVSAVAAEAAQPRRTVPVRITSRDEALAAAGSRYAPVSAGGRNARGVDAMVGKPCEVAGRRALDTVRGEESPVLLSFFCAGTPSQEATDALLEKNGIDAGDAVTELTYRGQGWPGDFTAVSAGGRRVTVDYTTSWGKSLGPRVQWRCRLCVDGVGESADITAGDFWEADERGYPIFEESAGRSALIARTERGRQIIEDAVAAGYLEIGPIDVSALLGVQRYQVERRKYLLGRLLGNKVTRGKNPAYKGFGLFRLVSRSPIRFIHEVRGTVRRIDRRTNP